MRLLLLILLTISSINLPAQTDSRIFYSQLMVVFSDLDKNFEFLKGELKEKDGSDTLFESKSTLEGTKENTILASSSMYAYQAIISDSISYEGSEFILKAWKEKLTTALNGSFPELEKKFHPNNDLQIDGYRYASEKITVLVLRHKSHDGSYWINLVIKSK